MKSIHLILNCLIILTHQCSNLMDNQLFITSTPSEIINIPLSQIFIQNDYDQITFQPEVNFLAITSPLQEIEKISNHRVKGQTISIKMLKLTTSIEPQHLMAILRFSEGNYYCEYDLKQYSAFPLLDAVFPSTSRANSSCYDIVLMRTLVIIECSYTNGDYFSILTVNQSPIVYLAIAKPKDSFRKLDMIDSYLIRGTIDKLELYEEKQLTLQLINSLDQDSLRILLNEESFQLQIKDFQTHTNGWISIMNESGELIILQYKDDQWLLVRCIDTQITSVYSYDLDVYRNIYVILSEKQLFTKTINSQKLTSIINSKPTDKVFLLKSSILLFSDKSIALYSQELYRFYSTILTDIKYQISIHSNSDGFLIIDDEYFYRYAVKKDYQLQFSAGTLPVETIYRMTNIVSKTNCIVKIYYMAVSHESKQIYYTQLPQSFIAQSIFQDNVDVKLNPIFQGSNLKFEFKEHDLLNLKVEQFQAFEILNIGDISDVIYRKSLSNLNNQNIQIIQQHNDKQISGFTCEVLSKLKLNCQSIFVKRQFEQLQDSDKQLWWFNNNSIFLAILQGSTINIYCVYYQQNKFDLLKTIILDENPKQIVTDGYHLLVNLEQSIKIYEITVENNVILLQTKNIIGDMYASPVKQNLFFMEQNGQLKIFSFEQQKFNLIWFTTDISINYNEKNFIILKNHFARLIKTKDEQEYIATVFNFQSLNNIYLEKQIKFDKNFIIRLTQIEVNLQQNLFYIVSLTNEKYNLLIYKIDETSFNSMFASLEYTSTAKFSISNAYCFITDVTVNNQLQQNYYITGENFVQSILKDSNKQIQYSKEISLILTVKNDRQNVIIYLNIPAVIINRGVSLFQTKDSLNLTFKQDSTQIHCLNLDQSWYSGQAFDITQNKDQEKIKYINTLSKQIETLEFSPFIQELNSEMLIQLMEDKIILVKKSDMTKKEFTIQNTYKINKLLFIQDQNIYVEAEKRTLIYIKIIQCQDSICNLLKDELQFPTSINKVFIDKNNFFIYSVQTIFVYDTKGNPLMVSEYEQFKEFTLFQKPFFLEFQHLKDNIYQVIFVDLRGNTFFNNFEVSKTSSDNQDFALDIVDILKQNKLYVSINSFCVGLILRKDEIIIVYNNIATFSFKFQFDCTGKKLCDLKYFELNGVYQQYEGWIIVNIYPIVYTNENILSMVYWAYNHFEILLFDLETESSIEYPKYAIAHLNTPSGEEPGDFFQIQSFIYLQNEILHLLASTEEQTKLQHYLLKRSPQVCTTEKQINQIIHLTLHNSISSLEANLNITISEDKPKPPTPPNDEDSNNFPIWAIVLIVIGILTIGFLIFYCWKKSKDKVQDNKLLLE
ncbi:unnamed protein product [Paramecium sonneborni]|uniref:Transmembrane protein n=1 Tax=Paramecium sonneborni TaxID=65129 RepID=A0A8S1QKL2_9CILI|nr:unnamed protein product [Paramecium sonneborni]